MNTPRKHTFEFEDLLISKESIVKAMGCEAGNPCPEPVAEAIDEMLGVAPDLCDVKALTLAMDDITVDMEKKQIRCGGEVFESGQIVTHQLRRSEKSVWFLCTAGKAISDKSRELLDEGDLMNGYALDVIANAVVETAMNKIQTTIREDAASEGMKITNRYSPGYCGWLVAEQTKLFKFFPDNFPGISLTDSCLMIPMKSVSGVIGVGAEVHYNDYTCEFCPDLNCIYRHKKG